MLKSDSAVLKPGDPGGLVLPLLFATIAIVAVLLVLSDSAFLIAGFCICLVVIALVRFEWFLYAQVFLLPWYPLLGANLPLRDVSMVLRFVSLAGVLVLRLQRRKSLAQWLIGGVVRKAILFFAAIATLSLLFSGLGPNIAALRSLLRLFSYLAVFWAISGWLEDRQQIEKLIKIVLCSGILVALFGFWQVWENGYTGLYYYLYPLQEDALEDWNGRITSFLFHFNSLAGYLNLVLPLSLASMVLARQRWVQFAALACHAVSLAALYFTGSRGGMIAYLVMLPISLYFLQVKRREFYSVLMATVLAAAIIVALQFSVMPSQGQSRFQFESLLIAYIVTLPMSVYVLRPKRRALLQVLLAAALAATIIVVLQFFIRSEGPSRLQEVDEFTSVSRLALWGAAGAMFLQHPILGVGYGNYRALYNDYIPGAEPGQLDAHNIYLQTLSETGLVGFGAFLILIVQLIRIALKLARNLDPLYRMIGIAMGGALAATLAHGMVDYLFNVSPQFGALFWLLMALGVFALDYLQAKGMQIERRHEI